MSPETGQGFPATCRIRKTFEYQRLYKTGRRIALPHFVIYWALREQGPSRLGITVSRKVGNAVVRNRCKRRTREFFRITRPQFLHDVDLSIQFRPRAAILTAEALRCELLQGLIQGGVVAG